MKSAFSVLVNWDTKSKFFSFSSASSLNTWCYLPYALAIKNFQAALEMSNLFRIPYLFFLFPWNFSSTSTIPFHLRNSCFSQSLFNSLAVSGGNMNLVPVSPPWLEAEVHMSCFMNHTPPLTSCVGLSNSIFNSFSCKVELVVIAIYCVVVKIK